MEIGAVKRKYNILYLDHGAKLIGGGQINTLSLIKELDKNVFSPMVVSSRENVFTEEARKHGVAVDVLPFPDSIITIYRSAIKYDPISLTRYGHALVSVIWRVARYVKDHNVDIVHPCDNVSRIAGGVAARICGVPAVCHITDDFENTLANKLLRTLILWGMDYIFPVSEKVAEFFKNDKHHKIIIVHTGIDLDYYTNTISRSAARMALNIANEELTIGIIGRLVPIKGHAELFQALARFKTKYSQPFRCIVVGDGPQRTFLCDLARELGIDNEVVFTGIANDFPRILAALDLVVVPSHTEASSRVVLEAGAVGIPVIGTRVGGIPEMIQEGITGLLVPLGDIDALVEALHCLQDGSLRTTMGKRASVRVREVFCSKKITSQIENIYLSLLRKRSENQ